MINYNEQLFTYAEVSEMLYNAKYTHLLEGHTYAEISEMMFAAKEK